MKKAFDTGVKKWLFCFTHPDDEISIIAWMKHLVDAGADVYAGWSVSNPVREREAVAMMESIGVKRDNLFFFDMPDGDACDHFEKLVESWEWAIEVADPRRIVVGAFECGHIDHDTTNAAVYRASKGRLPMFEVPFYHTYLTRIPVINRFADPLGEEVLILSPEDRRLKIRASKAYPSQNIGSLLRWYTLLGICKLSPPGLARTERMRLQTHFDYSIPNLPDPLRTRVEASAKFQRFKRAVVKE